MVIWVWIVWWLYASITPFIYRLWSVANYNIAYYWAMMSAERWLLALRYHDAWFEATSGLTTGNQSDNFRQSAGTSFGRFTADTTTNTYRRITSRVPSIPAPGKWNVESLFASSDSKNYNALGYDEWLEIPLYLDTTNNPSIFYQNWATIQPLDAWGATISLKGRFRLPPKIQSGLWGSGLDTSADIDDDTINDDVIVNWWLQGNDPINWNTFSIFPTIKNDFSSSSPMYAYDNSFRESIINEWDLTDNIDTSSNLGFSLPNAGSSLEANNILPLNSSYTGTILNDIITEATKPYLTFAITNRMQTIDNNIYPFLEWQLKACDLSNCNITLPDRFFSLQWVGIVKDYTVRILIQKPVRKTTNTANFTIIF